MNRLANMKCGSLVFAVMAASVCAVTADAGEIPLFAPFPQIDRQHWYISDGWANGSYQSCEWRADAISATGSNLLLTLSDKGGSIRPIGCAEMRTTSKTGYGFYEARMRSAAGSGLNTAFFTYIGPPNGVAEHDEIDFEFLGKDPHTVQLNYYTNGKPQDGSVINLGFDASQELHNYSFVWTPGKIVWYVDGKLVHMSLAGANIPRNPGYTYLSLWSGAKSKDDWLGTFNYKAPVTAEVSWVKYSPLL